MKPKKLSLRRTGVILHDLSIGYILVLNLLPELIKSSPYFLFSELFALSIVIWGFLVIYLKTGIWRYTHLAIKRLSEDEKREMNSVIRKAYTIISIVIVLLLFTLAVFELKITAVVAVALLYLAHILPASIVAWNRIQVRLDNK